MFYGPRQAKKGPWAYADTQGSGHISLVWSGH